MNTIKKLSESLERRAALNEMSQPRRKILNTISSKSDHLFEHVMKVVIYKNPVNCFKSRVHEIAGDIYYAIHTTAKPNNKKLKYVEYVDKFTDSGDDLGDVDYSVMMFCTKKLQKVVIER